MADNGEYARLINTHHKEEEEHRDIIKEIDEDEEESVIRPLMRQLSDMSSQSSLAAKGSSLDIAGDIEQGNGVKVGYLNWGGETIDGTAYNDVI